MVPLSIVMFTFDLLLACAVYDEDDEAALLVSVCVDVRASCVTAMGSGSVVVVPKGLSAALAGSVPSTLGPAPPPACTMAAVVVVVVVVLAAAREPGPPALTDEWLLLPVPATVLLLTLLPFPAKVTPVEEGKSPLPILRKTGLSSPPSPSCEWA